MLLKQMSATKSQFHAGPAAEGNAGTGQTGRHWTPPRKPTTVFQRAAVAAHIFVLFFSGFCVYPVLTYLAWTRWPILWFLMLEYLLYCNGPGKVAARSDRSGWPHTFRHLVLYKSIVDYFPIRMHKTADLAPGQPYIFCLHPHGIFAFSGFFGYATSAAGFDRLFPGIAFHGMTLVLSFKTPFLREYHLLHGNCDVSSETFTNVLGAGGAVGVVVGGAAEALQATPGTNRIILKRRKGFIKLALRTGASLVPAYAFGESSTYHTANELPADSRLRRWQRWMISKFGFTLPLFYGAGVLLPWGLLPYPVPINIVVGAPIQVPKYEGDTDSAEFSALLDKYHGTYMQALCQLFDSHQEKFAKGESRLEIVE